MLKFLSDASLRSHDPLTMENAIDDIWHPKCDVFQTDAQWIILVELAGVEKQNINISLADEYIKISGERDLHPENEHATYYSMEIETGRFERIIYFPDMTLDKDNPQVNYRDGILQISFKIEATIERIIPIE
ncbi:MAG: Hsp20/alpha crystallin family protein [Candidatus Syntrophosphaera sp.]|nr:Hsp20/alpha crystallin family protein [Candidatus Cloacimonadota bacterium]MDD5624883.1 Hsp20/alpha crystallin family protein [Candidatus Cloacimonadota bacterium]MDY0111716.1 Hsp20/alpha crystallin family protein [Candidatus Syntrophosphaera sp.]